MIAVVTTSYPTRGDDAAGHFVETEVRELLDSEQQVQQVHIVYPRHNDAFGSPGVIARLRARPWRALDVMRFLLQARRELRHAKPDKIIAHWILPCAWPIARGIAPLEIVAHGGDVRLLMRMPGALRRHILHSLVDAGATFRFVAHSLLESLDDDARAIIDSASRVAAAPLASGVELRASGRGLGLAVRGPFVVVVGRLIVSKRVDLAIDVAARAGVHLVVIGDGPERALLERRGGRCTFLGQLSREETLRHIDAAAALLHFSEAEAAPTVIREARALGTPVICSGAGDAARWAERDSGITVVEPSLAEDLVRELAMRSVGEFGEVALGGRVGGGAAGPVLSLEDQA